MNGNKYFLDTNAVIALLSGNNVLEEKLNAADWIGISVISILEFLSFPSLSANDRSLFTTFIKRIEIEGISNNDIGFLETVAAFKATSKLKLPDAVIASHAIQRQATLLSNDWHFEGIDKLLLQKF
jgi:tRNA(fMet)-specific endonuclease VapC